MEPVQLLRLHGVVEEADERGVLGLVEVLDTEMVLDQGDALLGDADGALLLVDLVVDVALHPPGDPGELLVPLLRLVDRSGDDQRRPGLVDEDGVDLVDDGEGVLALDEVLQALGHVVAQVVEAELVVGAVGDVRSVGSAPLLRALAVEDHAGVHADEAEDAAHEIALVLREVVVGRHDVHTTTGQGVQVRRCGGDEGLALAGLHLRDVAQVQRGPTHDLDVEVSEPEGAPRRLPHGGEGLGEQLVQRGTVGQPRTEPVGLGAELGVGQRDEVVLDRVDLVAQTDERLDDLAFAHPEHAVDDSHAVNSSSRRRRPRHGPDRSPHRSRAWSAC